MKTLKIHSPCFSVAIAIILLSSFVGSVSAEQIPSPQDFLGFKVGADYHLADYRQIREYFQLLDVASPLLRLEEIGQTTEGRPMILTIITSAFNQNHLENIRETQAALADPRVISEAEAIRYIRRGKTIVSINCSIHATEIGASQMAMELAYRLITSESTEIVKILENVVILLIPAHNPDGIDMVVDWYRQHLGSEYEGCRMPRMYHKYAGHDINRDWFMLTQKETRLTVEKVYNVWHPHIVLDLHQMGSSGARLFVPPYVDPIDYNIDPILHAEMTMLGATVAGELVAQGKGGVVVNAMFDAYSPSRAYPNYHGGIRMLLEAASPKLATPIVQSQEDLKSFADFDAKTRSWNHPLPWTGGNWRMREVVEYELEACFAVLTHASHYQKNYLRNAHKISEKAVAEKEAPHAILIPLRQNDPFAVKELIQVLQRGMVEVYQTREFFEAEDVPFEEGSLVIPMAQPYGGYARTLLMVEPYPISDRKINQRTRPYDVSAHNLPFLLGVKAIPINRSFEVDMAALDSSFYSGGEVIGGTSPYGYIIDHRNNRSFHAMSWLLSRNAAVYWLTEEIECNGKRFPVGTIWIKSVGSISDISQIANEISLDFIAAERFASMKAYRIRAPRVGLYQSWLAVNDEGWTRWVFEQYGLPYTTLHDSDIRAGNIRDRFDVVVLPSQRAKAIVSGAKEGVMPPEYCGGIGEIGVENLKDFVEQGGSLIAMDQASELPIKHFWIPVRNVLEDSSAEGFNTPGTLVRILVDNNHPIGYGMQRETAALCFNSPVFEVHAGTVVARYPLSDPLLCGWMSGADLLSMKTAVVEVPLGAGRVVLLGLRSQFRAQARSTYKLLFNAIFSSNAKLVEVP